MGSLIDGKAIAAKVKDEVATDVATFVQQGGAQPCLAVVLVGEDPASAIYVRHKIRSCEKCGIRSIKKELPATVTTGDVLAVVDELGGSPAQEESSTEFSFHVGESVEDALVARQGTVNLVVGSHEIPCMLEGGPPDAHGHRSHAGSRDVEGLHRRLEASLGRVVRIGRFTTEQVFGGNLDVVEADQTVFNRPYPHEAAPVKNLEAFGLGVDNEC